MDKKWIQAASFLAVSFVAVLTSFGQSVSSPCPTQILISNPTTSADLLCMVPQVYGPGGLVGANFGGPLDITNGHYVHFQASSVRSFGPINSEIGIQLSQLPLAAPVSGFIFSGGVVTRNATFGPILTDRAETLGKGRIFLGASYQYFNFNKADGVDLKHFGAVFTHEPEPLVCINDPNDPALPCAGGEPVYQRDIIATVNRIDLKVHQLTLVGSVGVFDKLDVTLAVPVLNVRLAVGSSANIVSFEPPPLEHMFLINNAASSTASFSDHGYSAGMGDLTIRAKYLAKQGERSATAIGVDFRIPTGDANNFLGSGTWGFRPFITYTAHVRRLTPHGTIGFQGNGESILAGDVTASTPRKAHLPDVLNYSFGVDGSVTHHAGFAFDFIGESLLQGTSIHASTYKDYLGNSHDDISPTTKTVNLASVSAGVKVELANNLLLSANGLFRVNDAGLRSRPTPLIGISYSF